MLSEEVHEVGIVLSIYRWPRASNELYFAMDRGEADAHEPSVLDVVEIGSKY